MKKYALIVGAGRGTRMGGEIPKQFLPLNGRPLIWYSIHAFAEAFPDIGIILVLPADQLERAEALRGEFPGHNIRAAAGGKTRFESVKNGLQLVEDDSLVFVHDAVRCLVSPRLIRACGEAAEKKGSAVPAISATDSVRLLTEQGSRPIDRGQVRIVQTPQVFPAAVLKEAFRQPFNESFTDEASVVEASGKTIHLVEGEKNNIKITEPKDLIVAEKLLSDSA